MIQYCRQTHSSFITLNLHWHRCHASTLRRRTGHRETVARKQWRTAGSLDSGPGDDPCPCSRPLRWSKVRPGPPLLPAKPRLVSCQASVSSATGPGAWELPFGSSCHLSAGLPGGRSVLHPQRLEKTRSEVWEWNMLTCGAIMLSFHCNVLGVFISTQLEKKKRNWGISSCLTHMNLGSNTLELECMFSCLCLAEIIICNVGGTHFWSCFEKKTW